MSKKDTCCVYCKHAKSIPKEFSSEHVMPKLFGLFDRDTMTLVDSVCRLCNQYFGDNLELFLGRDSNLGILYRPICGLIKPNKFEESICHKRKRIEPLIKHPDHGDLLVDTKLTDDKNFNVRIADQIIVMNSTKGNRVNFRPGQLPHRSVIGGIGLKPVEGYIKIFLRVDNISSHLEEINRALKKASIKIQLTRSQVGQFRLSPTAEPLYFKSTVDENIARALAKIIFNYFVHRYGGYLALSDSFDEIRSFIRDGLMADSHLITIDIKPIVAHQQRVQIESYPSHNIMIFKEPNSKYIIGRMSLFNNIHVEVILSRCFREDLLSKASQFDIINKKIIHH